MEFSKILSNMFWRFLACYLLLLTNGWDGWRNLKVLCYLHFLLPIFDNGLIISQLRHVVTQREGLHSLQSHMFCLPLEKCQL